MMPGWRLLLCAVGIVSATTPAFGQRRAEDDAASLEEQERQQQQQQQAQQQTASSSSRVAESAFGRAGERQTREDVAPNLHPMERISNRIDNRIRSRIRNRIDPDYNPDADARSSLEKAEENERKARH